MDIISKSLKSQYVLHSTFIALHSAFEIIRDNLRSSNRLVEFCPKQAMNERERKINLLSPQLESLSLRTHTHTHTLWLGKNHIQVKVFVNERIWVKSVTVFITEMCRVIHQNEWKWNWARKLSMQFVRSARAKTKWIVSVQRLTDLDVRRNDQYALCNGIYNNSHHYTIYLVNSESRFMHRTPFFSFQDTQFGAVLKTTISMYVWVNIWECWRSSIEKISFQIAFDDYIDGYFFFHPFLNQTLKGISGFEKGFPNRTHFRSSRFYFSPVLNH